MAEFTLLKLQVDDASFSAQAPFSGHSGNQSETEADEDERRRSLAPLVVGLVFLVGLAVLVRKLRGDSGEELVETEPQLG